MKKTKQTRIVKHISVHKHLTAIYCEQENKYISDILNIHDTLDQQNKEEKITLENCGIDFSGYAQGWNNKQSTLRNVKKLDNLPGGKIPLYRSRVLQGIKKGEVYSVARKEENIEKRR